MQASISKQNYNIQKWVAVVSVTLLVVKFTAYYFTHSVAILTDALESIVNVVAGFIGLYSLYIAAQPKDANHPYGHGKAEFLSAAVEGTMIGIAGVIILYKATYQLFHPVELQKIDVGIILIGITAFVNYGVGSICVRKGKSNKSIALEVSGKHLQTDTYSTLGVIVGLAVLYFTHLSWIDASVAIILALFIIYTSYNIIRRSVAGIMDEADEKLLTQIITVIEENRKENWVDLHNLRVIKYGSVLHVDCHLTVPWYFNVYEAHKEIDGLAELIKRDHGETLEIFDHADSCLELQCPYCMKTDCPVRKHPFEKTIEWTLQNVIQDRKHSNETSLVNS
jgi:cation diffusion facilitator family transporter